MYKTTVPLQCIFTSNTVWTVQTVQQCYSSTPTMGRTPLRGLTARKIQLHLYSLYGMYRLYTTSVHVQFSSKSKPPVGRTNLKVFSVCPVHLNLYFRYRPYRLKSSSVPVQYIYISTFHKGRTAFKKQMCLQNIYLFPLSLWSVHPVQSPSACNVQLYLYTSHGPCSLYIA